MQSIYAAKSRQHRCMFGGGQTRNEGNTFLCPPVCTDLAESRVRGAPQPREKRESGHHADLEDHGHTTRRSRSYPQVGETRSFCVYISTDVIMCVSYIFAFTLDLSYAQLSLDVVEIHVLCRKAILMSLFFLRRVLAVLPYIK